MERTVKTGIGRYLERAVKVEKEFKNLDAGQNEKLRTQH
jgi:hypothetical protein